MGVVWADSADKHGIPREEAMYAMTHAHRVIKRFAQPRVGGTPPMLFIGPSRFGTLEILATVRPPEDLWVFHVMRLRETTRLAAGWKEWSEDEYQ